MSNLISNLPLSYLLGAIIALLAFQVCPSSSHVFQIRLTSTQIIRNVFLSPLRQIPGPFLAKVTPYWLIFTDLAGHRTTALHGLHQRYGSMIRIGPNEVSYSNQDIIKEIYSQQTVFLKAPVYDTMVVPPGGIFSFRNKKQHSQRRRLLSHAFSQANLQDTEPLIRDHVKNALSCIDSSLGLPLDIFTSFRRLSFDIVGNYNVYYPIHDQSLTVSRRTLFGDEVRRPELGGTPGVPSRHGSSLPSLWYSAELSTPVSLSVDFAHTISAILPECSKPSYQGQSSVYSCRGVFIYLI